MEWIAVLTASVLGVAACAHVIWAFGGVWPARTRVELADMVIGHGQVPGFWPTILVASLLFCLAGYGPMVVWGMFDPLPSVGIAMVSWGIASVFILRAIATFTVPWFKSACEPFRSLDRLVYAPLCVVLAVGFMMYALI